MTHLDLAQFQALLGTRLSSAERDPLVDHLLQCQSCATEFKALHALEKELREPRKTRKLQIRYALGVAAVLIMALSPYVFRSQEKALHPKTVVLAQDDFATHPAVKIAIDQEILKLNYRTALDTWSHKKDVLSLVAIQNQSTNQRGPF